MDFNIKPWWYWGSVLSVTLMMFLMVNFMWPDKEYRTRTIDGDGRGYYDYLPTLVLHGTVDFKQAFEHQKENQPPGYLGHNFHKVNGVYVNKFTVGTALMILPFFVIAHVLSPLFGFPADGYSLLYQYEVALAALWWLWVGLFFLIKLLKSYHIPDNVSFLVVLFLLTGTNLFHYAFVDVAFSHIYSFGVITAFLYVTRQLFLNFSIKRLTLAAFLLGWIVLIRPVNFLVVLIVPFFAPDLKSLREMTNRIFSSFKTWLVPVLFFLLAISPQLLINYLQTGNPVVYGYKGEGFYFFNPHLAGFLFGYKKGWFVYTPVMLLLIPALYGLFRKSKHHFWVFIGFLFILIYVFSSWWNWYYGDGFGMRPMVEYYSLFTVVIALWVISTRKYFKLFVLFIALLFSVLNMVQSYQYFVGIITPDSMTKKAYWHQFFKTSNEYRNVVGSSDEYFYGKLSGEPLLFSVNDFEHKQPGWSWEKSLDSSHYKSPVHALLFSKDKEFGGEYKQTLRKVSSGKRYYLKLTSFCFETIKNAALGALFVVDIRNESGVLKYYKGSELKRLPDKQVNRWWRAHAGYIMPPLKPGDQLKVYIWNKNKNRFYVDDFSVSLYEIY